MTKDDIIRMAREANIGTYINLESYLVASHLERFAELVAAAERKACAMLCEEPYDLIQITDDCSEYVYKDHLVCADAIRARGQK
jgi:hypothetical protein